MLLEAENHVSGESAPGFLQQEIIQKQADSLHNLST